MELHPVQLRSGCYMLKRTKKRGKHCAGLLLLAVFLNLFFIQLACSLPHLIQKLALPASAHAYEENDGHGHSHDNNTTADTSSDHHDGEGDSHNNCCSEQETLPFLKASVDSGWFAAVKGQLSPLALLTDAFYSCFSKASMEAVSHAPPEDLPPKIPDIRIFLQSLILFDLR